MRHASFPFLIGAIAFLFPCCLFSEGLKPSDFGLMVNGKPDRILTLRQPQLAVRAVLGKPEEAQETVDEHFPSAVFVEWRYRGCRVIFVKGSDKVYSIFATGKGFSTPRGVKVGATESEVIHLYGKGERHEDQRVNGHFLLYSITVPFSGPELGEDYFLSFLIRENAVAEIQMNAVGHGSD